MNRSRGGTVFAQYEAKKGGLARTRKAYEKDKLPFEHLEIDAVEGGLLLARVELADILKTNHSNSK
jgi:hypothetical protein